MRKRPPRHGAKISNKNIETRPLKNAARSLLDSPLRWWEKLPRAGRGMALVSLGSFGLVLMAALAKYLGERLPPFEILFFRSAVGFVCVLWVFRKDLLEPLRTKRPGAHLFRGIVGAGGNACFFWTITHMMLADSLALQFSRPLWMIPLAMCFLSEVVGFRRAAVACAGFCGILLYARPFTEGFDPNAIVGAFGGLFAALVVVAIKNLQTTESTRVIMFYYAWWNAFFAALPAFFTWITPTGFELALLILIGVMGIGGQALITHGLSMGDATALVPLDYARVVYAAILGYVIFGEVPGLWSFAGMALIIAASLYLVLTERKKRAG
ncbi:MAG: DMT family transporter [Alphaproteobacteria bacterium]|nr:DMT family transporter [Alphaproteobacteria bacterium]